MRRRFLTCTALLTTLVLAAACTDGAPTNSSLTTYNRIRPNQLLADYIQEQIFILLPKGFEDAVNARWATVQEKKAAGDIAGATKALNTLATWIDKKTGEITIPAGSLETKNQAAVRLVLNMSRWFYEGEDSPVVEELPGEDVTVEVVPAGTPFEVSAPSDHAAVAAGPQGEDRIWIISEEDYPGNCAGPLPTTRCQYPLFYRIESFPDNRIIGRGRFAVCIHTYPNDRRPIEYPQDDGTVENPHHEGPVHQRLRLAHNLNDGGRSQGGTVEGDVEILELVSTLDQTGIAHCDEPSTVGWSAPAKVMYAVTKFIGRVISPKNLYAIDQGPEHYSDFASHFNALDPNSQPDLVASLTSSASQAFPGDAITLSYAVANKSRREVGGNATGPNLPTTASILLFSDEGLTNQVGEPLASGIVVGAKAPDGPVQAAAPSVTLPTPLAAGRYYLAFRVAPSPAISGAAEGSLSGEYAGDDYANNTAAVAIEVRDPAVATTMTFSLPVSNICGGPSGCGEGFVEGGYIVQSFWFDPPQRAAPHWIDAHLHLGSGVEQHHWQGDEARQGVRIRRQDGRAFTLKSIDYQNATTPFEVGTTAITSIVGDPTQVSGYTLFPVTTSDVFQTLQFSGFANVSEVWITMRQTANWDNVVLSGPPILPSLMAAAANSTVTSSTLYEPARADLGQPDRIKQP